MLCQWTSHDSLRLMGSTLIRTRLLQTSHKMHNVAVIRIELIACSIETDDDVLSRLLVRIRIFACPNLSRQLGNLGPLVFF